MNLSDFDFHLPAELVAQVPLPNREDSRLMVVDRATGRTVRWAFSDLPERLRRGDVLVVNDSQVIPVRLIGKKPTGGKVDMVLLDRLAPCVWKILAKGVRTGRVVFPNGLSGRVWTDPDATRHVEFETPPDDYLRAHGLMPLPPYIRREPTGADRDRYQTVYARNEGSIAAPTAGLHFSMQVLEHLRQQGIVRVDITLHVGPGTFMPVKTDDVRRHKMPPESYYMPEESADILNAARAEGRRVIAVGTTVTRTLESALTQGRFQAGPGNTSLFILPGYDFRAVNGLITNFHLPKGTPLMLVSAFLGHEKTLQTYRDAVRERYRFFSYGDAMLIL